MDMSTSPSSVSGAAVEAIEVVCLLWLCNCASCRCGRSRWCICRITCRDFRGGGQWCLCRSLRYLCVGNSCRSSSIDHWDCWTKGTWSWFNFILPLQHSTTWTIFEIGHGIESKHFHSHKHTVTSTHNGHLTNTFSTPQRDHITNICRTHCNLITHNLTLRTPVQNTSHQHQLNPTWYKIKLVLNNHG